MEAYKIKGFLMQAMINDCPEVVITLFPPEGKSEGIEIFVSLSGVSYNGVETKGDVEGDTERDIVKLFSKNREPFLLFSKEISDIKCS